MSEDDTKALLRSCLLSSKNGLSLRDLESDYDMLVGGRIPFRKFGFSSLEEYLRSIPDVVDLRGSGAGAFAHCVVDSSTARLASLIQRQKSSKKRPTVSRMVRRPASILHRAPAPSASAARMYAPRSRVRNARPVVAPAAIVNTPSRKPAPPSQPPHISITTTTTTAAANAGNNGTTTRKVTTSTTLAQTPSNSTRRSSGGVVAMTTGGGGACGRGGASAGVKSTPVSPIAVPSGGGGDQALVPVADRVRVEFESLRCELGLPQPDVVIGPANQGKFYARIKVEGMSDGQGALAMPWTAPDGGGAAAGVLSRAPLELCWHHGTPFCRATCSHRACGALHVCRLHVAGGDCPRPDHHCPYGHQLRHSARNLSTLRRHRLDNVPDADLMWMMRSWLQQRLPVARSEYQRALRLCHAYNSAGGCDEPATSCWRLHLCADRLAGRICGAGSGDLDELEGACGRIHRPSHAGNLLCLVRCRCAHLSDEEIVAVLNENEAFDGETSAVAFIDDSVVTDVSSERSCVAVQEQLGSTDANLLVSGHCRIESPASVDQVVDVSDDVSDDVSTATQDRDHSADVLETLTNHRAHVSAGVTTVGQGGDGIVLEADLTREKVSSSRESLVDDWSSVTSCSVHQQSAGDALASQTDPVNDGDDTDDNTSANRPRVKSCVVAVSVSSSSAKPRPTLADRLHKLDLCDMHSPSSPCKVPNCKMLHLCKYYIADLCPYGDFCYGRHSLSSRDVNNLHDAGIKCSLKRLLDGLYEGYLSRHPITSKERSGLLQLCLFYNCPSTNYCCYRMHLCLKYVVSKCDAQCHRSAHDIRSPRNLDILKAYQMDHLSDESILSLLLINSGAAARKKLGLTSTNNVATTPTMTASPSTARASKQEKPLARSQVCNYSLAALGCQLQKCGKAHACLAFSLDICRRSSCAMPHVPINMDGVDTTLKQALQKLMVCCPYNTAGSAPCGASCQRFHLCHRFLSHSCTDRSCWRSHHMSDAHNQRVKAALGVERCADVLVQELLRARLGSVGYAALDLPTASENPFQYTERQND